MSGASMVRDDSLATVAQAGPSHLTNPGSLGL